MGQQKDCVQIDSDALCTLNQVYTMQPAIMMKGQARKGESVQMSVIMQADEPRKHARSRNEIQGMRVRLSVSRADYLLVSVGHKPAFFLRGLI